MCDISTHGMLSHGRLCLLRTIREVANLGALVEKLPRLISGGEDGGEKIAKQA